MKWIICDTEVFKEDNIFVGKYFGEDKFIVSHNIHSELVKVIDTEDVVFIGFNMKGYDQFVMKAMYNSYAPEEIKKINDFIIGGGRGYDLKIDKCNFNICDIMDDMQMGTSLKSIEGHLGNNIHETGVDFNIDRKLTKEEIESSIEYCKADVINTEKVVQLRMDYLKTKINLGASIGLSEAQSLSMTNAKLTASYLSAKKEIEWADEREYVIPSNLKVDIIPQEILDFFNKVHDKSIPDDVVFKSSLDYTFGNCPSKLAWGGLHGAVPQMIYEANDNYTIRNYDVGSYYPSLMIQCGYLSRNIPSQELFKNVVKERLQAKKAGDKQKANDLKLIVNTTYGATLNQYNELYDPLMARSVCISGQLFLSELCMSYLTKVPNMEIIQINTDGVMIGFDPKYSEIVNDINNEWQSRTGFTLEEDIITKVVQKDVNNYLMIGDDGHFKTKGAYFKHGINTIGAFSINNNMTIVIDAILDYFTKGIPVEETINNCTDIFKFQLIAKGSSKYDYCYQEVGTGHMRVQKVNRVYATNDDYYGTLYKVKKGDGSIAKIAGLPEHCLVDNANSLTINNIDKQFYIDVANKRINDFKGGQTMATKETSKNVYQKLLTARTKFLANGVKKSGKNFGLSYKYFELEDIIPSATKIFNEVGLIALVSFAKEEATMRIVDTETREEVSFTTPMVYAPSNKGTTEIQALGSTQTYIRRYLYLTALDICEADSIDNDKPVATPNVEEPARKAPEPILTPSTTQNVENDTNTKEEENVAQEAPKPAVKIATARKAIKEQVVATDEPASDLQITGLKNVMREYLTATNGSAEAQSKIKSISAKTKGLTEITKIQCETVITALKSEIDKAKVPTLDTPDLPF